jgi:hypothetical protein
VATREPAPVRLLPQGARVILLHGAAPRAGSVAAVRLEAHLKTYVVQCDDGSTAFASAYDLAREDDPTRTALGARPELF